MSLMTSDERRVAAAMAALTYGNPFLPERIAHERVILGAAYRPAPAVWHRHGAFAEESPNLDALDAAFAALADKLRDRLAAGAAATREERALYEDIVTYNFYHVSRTALQHLVSDTQAGAAHRPIPGYDAFLAQVEHYFGVPGGDCAARREPAHLFACLFQVRRAFHHIFDCILGGSMPAVRLRAAVWQSVFTHNLRRYQHGFWRQMGDMTTLITGPTGTGKELVARAIGLSRYVPFDGAKRVFTADYRETYCVLNIAALAPTLIESELFGHRRGAFTGAVEDRAGWLEVCGELGTVFLDEIGDLPAGLQTKLLRVLQNREFQRVGETKTRHFPGKVVAATNRDLEAEMRAGNFRPDLYYRLRADLVRTPSLAEQLRECPADLPNLVAFLVTRIVGPDEAPAATATVVDWLTQHLDPAYGWPGNVRELDQCVRSILIRGEYQPTGHAPGAAGDEWLAAAAAGTLDADTLLRHYAALVHRQTGSYVETARRLGLDRRTVKAKLGGP